MQNKIVKNFIKNSVTIALIAMFFLYNIDTAQALMPNDSKFAEQWYLQRINAQLAWDVQHESPQIVIAVLDTGVDIDHPDLRDNIWVNKGEIPDNNIDDDKNGYIDDVNGWDFFNNTADPRPKFSPGFSEVGIHHGTLVAGVAAAAGNNSFAVTGVSWRAQIMPLKVLTDSGQGRTADVIKAIDYATQNGAHIINLSFVGVQFSDSLEEAIRRAYKDGVIIVAAAGNENEEGDGYSLDKNKAYPVCYDGSENMVIGVAATDAIDQKAVFSNYGFSCVDIAAPGTNIFGLSVYNPDMSIGSTVFNKYTQGYWSGTSLAAPIVSGALALLKSINPKLKRDQLVNILLTSTDNIDAINPKYFGQLGVGRLNLQRAVARLHEAVISYDNYILSAPQSATTSSIRLYADDNKISGEFQAYAGAFLGGASVASGDIDGDGIDEIITGAGPGGGPHVRVFNAGGELKNQFFAYDKNSRNGVNVAVGDVNGNGANEIIAGAGSSQRPEVKIFGSNSKLMNAFLAYPQNIRSGVKVSAGDVNGDGNSEIIVGTGIGGGPQIRIFNQSGGVIGQFFAYDKNFRGGVNVAAGDTNNDGIDEVITGAGPGGGPHLRMFTSSGRLLNGFYAYDTVMSGGVNVNILKIRR